MRAVGLRLAALAAVAALAAGCTTLRSATFPGRSYDAVFKGTVQGLCNVDKLIVYRADKEAGKVYVVQKGFGHMKHEVVVTRGVTPGVSIFMPGVTPLPDMMIGQISLAIASLSSTPAK